MKVTLKFSAIENEKINDNPDFFRKTMADLSKFDIPFIPVHVTKGRKFKGYAYMTESWRASNGGYARSGCRPLAYYRSNKGVDAITLEPVYFNGEPEAWGVEESDLALAKRMYIRRILEACVKRCGEDYMWRANYLQKVLGCNSVDAASLACAAEEYLHKDEDEGNGAERLEAELEIREGIVSSNN